MSDEWYSLKRILKTNADFYMIYGQRSNGKTYSVLQYCLDNNLKVAYIRRYYEEIAKYNVTSLYHAHYGDWSKEDYTDIIYKSRSFFYAKINDDNKIVKTSKESLCDVFALNTWERSKGADRGHYDVIIFDEFLTKTNYLEDELERFKNLLSSLIRYRDNVKIFLLGNTVNKYCPYFSDFEITNIIKNLKIGEVRTKILSSGAKIAIERCERTTKTEKVRKFFEFGRKKNMITTGVWEIDSYPHVTGTIVKEEIVKTAYIIDEDFNLATDIVIRDNLIFLRVRQQTKEIDIDNNIVYCTVPSPNPLHTTSIFKPRNKAHKLISDLIYSNQVYFTTNEIGEQWENYLKKTRKIETNIVYKLS